MRDTIIEFFKKNEGKFVSGQAMSDGCNVSRTAIWKHIQALRNRGYEIESSTKKGYRLISSPDLVSPLEVEGNLTTKIIGCNYQYQESTESTNTVARNLAIKGAKEGTIVIAEEQVAGRGRIQRGWFSPYTKGLWMSIILRPPFLPMEAPKCTLMAAVAITKAFHELGLTDARIKWPNDILVNGKKIVGILTEMQSSMEQIHFIIIGIGVNVSIKKDEFPEELQEIATSLAMEGISVSRTKVLATIAKYLEAQYLDVCENGFKKVLEDWRKLSMMLGKEVQVNEINNSYTGFADDIDCDGNLMVTLHDGSVKRVVAGDISVRAMKEK